MRISGWFFLICFLVLGFTPACGRRPEDKVSVLLRELRNRNPGNRAMAALELSRTGASRELFLPHLIAALEDNSLNVRHMAALSLSELDPPPVEAVPSLIKLLGTDPQKTPGLEGPARYYADARMMAAYVLGLIGPRAGEAIPALEEASRDGNEQVREQARNALRLVTGGDTGH